MTTVKKSPSNDDKHSVEEMLAGFRALQQEQQMIIHKMNDIQGDIREHQLVISTLQKADASRRCWRSVGGVLIERTVSEILPGVKEQLKKLQEANTAYEKKFSEVSEKLGEYRTKNNIRFVNDAQTADTKGDASSAATKEKPQSAVIDS